MTIASPPTDPLAPRRAPEADEPFIGVETQEMKVLRALAALRLRCCDHVAATQIGKRSQAFALEIWKAIEAIYPAMKPETWAQLGPAPPAGSGLPAAPAPDWKAEVTDIAVVCWVLSEENKDNPRQMVADIVQQSVKEALDPAVSEAACALRDTYLADLTACRARVEGLGAALETLSDAAKTLLTHNVVSAACDCGPEGEGWQSNELATAFANLEAAIRDAEARRSPAPQETTE